LDLKTRSKTTQREERLEPDRRESFRLNAFYLWTELRGSDKAAKDPGFVADLLKKYSTLLVDATKLIVLGMVLTEKQPADVLARVRDHLIKLFVETREEETLQRLSGMPKEHQVDRMATVRALKAVYTAKWALTKRSRLNGIVRELESLDPN